MHNRFMISAAIMMAAGFAVGQTAPAKAWSAPRNTYGQPDLQGVWNSGSLTPFQRLPEVGAKQSFTKEEAAAFEAALSDGLWSTRALADVRTEQIIQLHQEGLSQRDIAHELCCGLGTVNRTIKRHKEAE